MTWTGAVWESGISINGGRVSLFSYPLQPSTQEATPSISHSQPLHSCAYLLR